MESRKLMGVCIQKIASKMEKPLGGKGLMEVLKIGNQHKNVKKY